MLFAGYNASDVIGIFSFKVAETERRVVFCARRPHALVTLRLKVFITASLNRRYNLFTPVLIVGASEVAAIPSIE